MTTIDFLNSKADAALPILHIVFDIASGENAQVNILFGILHEQL